LFSPSSIDELIELVMSDRPIEFDIARVISFLAPTSELVLMALYPSRAIRGIAGTVRNSKSGLILSLEDPLCLIDPDAAIEDFPPTGLLFSMLIAPFRFPNP